MAVPAPSLAVSGPKVHIGGRTIQLDPGKILSLNSEMAVPAPSLAVSGPKVHIGGRTIELDPGKLRGVGMTAALRPGEFRPRLEAVSEMSGAGARGGETISMAAVPEGATPLMYACQQSRVNELANMINAKPGNIRDRDRTLKTALHYCAENQKADCAELLVSAAPDLVDARDEDGYTPLHLAVISGNIGFVRFLLGRGASLAALDNERHSVVHWATVCGELEALQTVLEAGAEASSPDMHGGYPVHYAAQMCGPGSEANGDKSVGMSVLAALLDHKVAVNVTDKDGRQPILWAASAGSADAILALVNAGANVEADDKDGLTALHCAASRGHTECLETLITLCGAQVDLMDSNGCTALFYAATLGHADATQLLLTLNAQPNRQDRKGRTPAHCGAAKGQLETLRLLSEHDADMWVRNAKGDYTLHEAVASGRKELVTWLLAQRPDAVNAANNDGRCPLHIAAIYNNVQMCKILLDAESLVNPVTRSSKGQLMTPLDAALYKGNRGCAKYLQLHGGVPATKLTPEAAALRGVANKSEIEQREARSRGATPDMLNVPKGKQREPRSLQTSPVTITGNKQLTLVDASHNSHILQVHVQDQLSVMGDESQEVSESGADRRTKKRRHKRHSRRTDDDDYASGDSDSRDRRRRRRRDDESSEEDEEEEDGEEDEEGSGSRGGRKRRGGRRERERTDGSDYESDESEHSRRGRRRKDKNRRGKKERRSLRRERSDDLNDGDDQKRRSTKGRERKRVIKEETKRSEIIKSKKVIEESMDDDESAPVTKSSITTSEERKEQTLKTVSEVVDGEEVPTESEKTGEERVVQVVEAEVHQEQQNEEDTQDGRASKTETDQGESTTAEGESTKKGDRKSKLKKMDREEITSKQSESQRSDGAATAASATEDDSNEAAERAAKLEEQTKSEEEEEERKRQEEEEAQRRSEEEEERQRQEEEERKRQEEEEEEQRRSEEEEERKAKEEAERLAREEAERQAKEEAEKRAREEEEIKAREEAERIAREEAEKRAREEAEEAERKAKEEAERIAKEEAERKAREEAERKAQEEAERKALEEQKHGRMAAEVKRYEDVKTVIENMKGDAETGGNAGVENEPVTEEEVNKTTIQATEGAPPQEVVESEDTEAARSEVSMLKTPRSPSVQSSPRTPETATPRRRSNRLAAEMKKYEDVKTAVGNMKSHVHAAGEKHDRMAVEVKRYEDVKTVIENMKGEEEYEEEEAVAKRSPRRGKAKDGERKKVRSKSRDRKDKKDEEEGETAVQKRKASGKKKGVRVNEGGKTKREVNVSMDKIVDEATSKRGNEDGEEQEDEEEDDEEFYSDKTISGDEESVDLDPGRALVKIIGRAREEREPRSRRRRRKMSGGGDRPARARSSFSVVSDSLSTHLDSGFEPSPRNDRINEARDRRRDRSAGPELTPASVTQAVQHSIRRYHLERRIFHELLELKRLQIRAGRSNEAVLVKRLAEEYKKAALDVGLIPYQGPFSFGTFENYLYDQLRKLQIAERKMVPKLQSNDELERLTAALRKTRTGKAFLESVPDSPAYCTHSTHRCSHATHAYTGIPCAAYITKANHHTVPKPPRSGFLPRIEAADKRSKEGQSAEIARCLRYVDPSRPVTLELSHGKDRQVISLPTENLDKNKRYYVTFTIKGGESASETTGDERKHRHAKSF